VSAGPRRVAVRGAHALARRAGRAYVAGPQLDDAVAVVAAAREAGLAVTLAFWEPPGTTASSVAAQGHRALAALPGAGGQFSLKAPSLAFDDDLLCGLADGALAHGAGLMLDGQHPTAAPATQELARLAAERGADAGCALPARWPRSDADAERAIERGLRVRLVKGQWPDPEADRDPSAALLGLARRLGGRARGVAVATHDAPLARAALETLLDSGTPCELELLYGLPRAAPIDVARALGVAVRLYIPFGHAQAPYDPGDARHRRRVGWWLVRDGMLARPRRDGGVPGRLR
jgi:proline dehydrogenase